MSAAVGTRIEKINLRMECSYVTGNGETSTPGERPPSYVNFLTACLPSRAINVNRNVNPNWGSKALGCRTLVRECRNEILRSQPLGLSSAESGYLAINS